MTKNSLFFKVMSEKLNFKTVFPVVCQFFKYLKIQFVSVLIIGRTTLHTRTENPKDKNMNIINGMKTGLKPADMLIGIAAAIALQVIIRGAI